MPISDQINAIPAMTELRSRPVEKKVRGVHIRGVPHAIWQRARQNALASELPFKDYVIRLLAESGPYVDAPLENTT